MVSKQITTKTSPRYSIVIPCYRSEKSISELLHRIVKQFESIDKSFEVICVNDSSPDKVGEIILDFHHNDPRIKLINLLKNNGQHQALLIGFEYSKGDYILTIDDDLQHAPEDIPLLINGLGDYDVLNAVPKLKKHAAYRNLGSWLMRLITRMVFNPPSGYVSSAFRIIKRSVINQLVATHTAYPYISGMILRITHNIGNIDVEHYRRKSGESGYTFRKSVKLASNLIINYTKIPLNILIVLGTLISSVSFVLIIYIAVGKLLFTNFQAGWPSLIIVISFFGGINLLAFAVIAEYLIRLLNEISDAKRSVVSEVFIEKTVNSGSK